MMLGASHLCYPKDDPLQTHRLHIDLLLLYPQHLPI